MPLGCARPEVFAGLIQGLSWDAERALSSAPEPVAARGRVLKARRRKRGVHRADTGWVGSRHKKAPDDAGALELLN